MGSAYTHVALGYAPVWSSKFARVPGARVDWGAFTWMAGAVGFFFDCGWDGGVFFSGEAEVGKESLMTADGLASRRSGWAGSPPLQI